MSSRTNALDRNNTARVTIVAVALLCVALLAGCGTNRRYANNMIRQLPHSNVHIEYTWNEPAELLPAHASDGQVARSRMLSVVYPHPDPAHGRKFAEVTLRPAEAKETSSKAVVTELLTNPFKPPRDAEQGDGSDSIAGTLRLAVPREQLEFLLRDLVADSYFDREQRGGEVDLRVTLGSRTTAKPWDRIAGFEELASRVIAEHHKNLRAKQAAPRGSSRAGAELLAPPTGSSDANLPADPN